MHPVSGSCEPIECSASVGAPPHNLTFCGDPFAYSFRRTQTNKITSMVAMGGGHEPKYNTPRGRRHNPPYTKENQDRHVKAIAREISGAANRRARYASRERDYNVISNQGTQAPPSVQGLGGRTPRAPPSCNPITGAKTWY